MSTCTTRSTYLDSLKRRLESVDICIRELRSNSRGKEERRALLKKRRALEDAIKEQSQSGVAVSDHAIVRYMQRVHEIDIDQIKSEIVGFDHKAHKLPDGQFGVNGHKIRVKDGVVVTVVVRDQDRD